MLGNNELREYVKSLEVSDVIAQRAEQFLEWFKLFSPEPTDDVVIGDYVKEDGSRVLESLWFFSNSFMMEAKQFLNPELDDIDLAAIRAIKWFSLQKHE